MRIYYLIYLLLLCVLFPSCSFRLSTYLKHSTPTILRYNCVEKCYHFIPDSSLPKFTSTNVYYGNFKLEEEIVYYDIPIEDSSKWYGSINSNNFLFSFMIFKKDIILLADKIWKSDIQSLQLKDFKYNLPSKVKARDSVFIKFGEKINKLYHFHKENLRIGDKELKNCFVFDIEERWPANAYFGKIWLHKNMVQ